jgi:hypothetical protein
MSDEIELGKLKNRELLILAVQGINSHSKRLDAHAEKIRALEHWRNYIGGGMAVITAWLGLKKGD